MALILSMTESDSRIVAGVPEYVEFTTSEPATVFYTIDGTDPDEDSDIAVDEVYLPTTGTMFTLKAIAISSDIESDILEMEYGTNQLKLTRVRLTKKEGINILPVNKEPEYSMGYDVNGEEVRESVIDLNELDLVASTTNYIGEEIFEDESETTIDFINLARRTFGDNKTLSSSVHDADFDPNARVILIDGSTQERLNSQTIKVINRPHGTISTTSKHDNEENVQMPLITGNFLRMMYNERTGTIVFYYTESRENRWIKSVQNVRARPIRCDSMVSGVRGFVFRWIEDRTVTKLF